jgi:hypothetical protein
MLGNFVTWHSKKQSVVATSSVEAKFRAMTQGVCEISCLKILLKELGYGSKDSMRLYYNNKLVINIAHNPV